MTFRISATQTNGRGTPSCRVCMAQRTRLALVNVRDCLSTEGLEAVAHERNPCSYSQLAVHQDS